MFCHLPRLDTVGVLSSALPCLLHNLDAFLAVHLAPELLHFLVGGACRCGEFTEEVFSYAYSANVSKASESVGL